MTVRMQRGTFEVRHHRDTEWDDILDVDRLSFPKSEAWKPGDFGRAGTVQIALVDSRIVAYAAWRRLGGALWLLRVAVLPEFRRRGIALALVRQKAARLDRWGKDAVARAVVPEEYVAGQLLLRKAGWVADRLGCSGVGFVFRAAWNLDEKG